VGQFSRAQVGQFPRASKIDINNPYKLFSRGELGIVVNLSKIQEAATERLSSYAEYLESNGIEGKVVVAAGPLVSEVLRIAREEQVSLIVTGRQDRSLLGDLFFGSSTDRIIRESPIPVLVMGHQASNQMKGEAKEQVCHKMFRKILFALDWSPETERAREYLQALRQLEASEVIRETRRSGQTGRHNCRPEKETRSR
jgi:nucleotide-binding universal stress UspA family protein